MQRLNIAKREIRAFMSDRMAFRGLSPHEVKAMANLREALALITEAELACAQVEVAYNTPEPLLERLRRLG